MDKRTRHRLETIIEHYNTVLIRVLSLTIHENMVLLRMFAEPTNSERMFTRTRNWRQGTFDLVAPYALTFRCFISYKLFNHPLILSAGRSYFLSPLCVE